MAAGSMGDWNQTKDGAIGTHTDAGGQLTGICADRVARILHTGMRSGGLGRRKARRGCLRNVQLGGQNG